MRPVHHGGEIVVSLMTSFVAPANTFMSLAGVSSSSRVAVVGIPLEAGAHPLRNGSRLGPGAIRRQSLLLGRYGLESGVDVPAAVGLCDVGDVPVIQSDLAASFEAIEGSIGAMIDAGLVPIGIGGDGTVTLPQLRAAAKRHPGLVVVHVDAHTDAYPDPGYIGPTAFARAAEERLIDPAHSFHVGLRGPVRAPGLLSYAGELGYNLILMRELRERGFVQTAEAIKAKVGDRPVYLCWDLDFLEPTAVTGVLTPVCDGAQPHEALALLKALAGLNFVLFDINNMTPTYDVGDYTALLGAHIVWTCAEISDRSARSRPA